MAKKPGRKPGRKRRHTHKDDTTRGHYETFPKGESLLVGRYIHWKTGKLTDWYVGEDTCIRKGSSKLGAYRNYLKAKKRQKGGCGNILRDVAPSSTEGVAPGKSYKTRGNGCLKPGGN